MKDLKVATSEMRKAVAFLKQEAGRVTKDGKKDLTASIHEFEKMANEVEKGAGPSEKRLKDAFARANQALANYHYLKASEYWAKKEEKKTGHALNSATPYFDQAVGGPAITLRQRKLLLFKIYIQWPANF